MHPPALRLALLLLVLASASTLAKMDPSTGKVRVMFVGEISFHNEVVLDWLLAEPRLELTRTVPCDIQIVGYDAAVRFARIYLPRSYDDLFYGNDVVIFHDFHPKVFPSGRLEWFRQAVEEGLGMCLIEFAYRVAGYAGMDVWPTLKIYDLFPARFETNQVEAIYGRQFLKVVRQGPLVDLPGLEKYHMNWGWHGDLTPREGSTIWAAWKGRGTPSVITRRYGASQVLQWDSGYDTLPEETKRNWRYVTDWVYNHVTFVSGLPFPDDLELVHTTRDKFIRYRQEKTMAVLVLEFIEKFGANPATFEVRMAEMNDDFYAAEMLYIEGSMIESAEIMGDLLERFELMNADMMEAKDRAMLWIYVSEWLVVSATSMVCGFVLWTLMIRRRLYREIEVTRSTRVCHKSWER